jgi:hypothetical protein
MRIHGGDSSVGIATSYMLNSFLFTSVFLCIPHCSPVLYTVSLRITVLLFCILAPYVLLFPCSAFCLLMYMYYCSHPVLLFSYSAYLLLMCYCSPVLHYLLMYMYYCSHLVLLFSYSVYCLLMYYCFIRCIFHF